MNGEEKAIVGVKMANHKIIPVLTGEENAGHAVFTTVADNQKKAIFSFYYMDNGIDDWQPEVYIKVIKSAVKNWRKRGTALYRIPLCVEKMGVYQLQAI